MYSIPYIHSLLEVTTTSTTKMPRMKREKEKKQSRTTHVYALATVLQKSFNTLGEVDLVFVLFELLYAKCFFFTYLSLTNNTTTIHLTRTLDALT